MTKSTYHALLIAVQEYDDLAVNDLVHPIGDARRLREVLAEEYVFDAARIQLLENPDRAELIGSLEKQAKRVKPEDHLLIFFAGHGYWDPDRRQGYWLPSDAGRSSRSNWISNGDIRDLIVGVPCRHTLLISDACFSGGLFRTRKAFADPDRSVEMLYQLPSRKAMTSGTLKEVPDESVFLRYLTDRLKKNKNAWLSSERLFIDLKEPVLSNSANIPQYGTIQGTGDEGGDFVFLRREVAVEKVGPSPIAGKKPEQIATRLVLIAEQAGAVKVDGQDKGLLVPGEPLSLSVIPGRHVVQVLAEGFKPWRKTIAIVMGHGEVIEVALERVPEIPKEAKPKPIQANPVLETAPRVEKKMKAVDREAKPVTLMGNKGAGVKVGKGPRSRIPLYAGGLLGVIAVILLISWAMNGEVEPSSPELPTASLEVDKNTIVRGESIMLSWLVSNATEVRITPDVGSVDSTGSRSLEPEEDVTYTLTALGEGGEVTNTLFIQVAEPPVQPVETNTSPSPASSKPKTFVARNPFVLNNDFVRIEAGSFMMGSEQGDTDETPVHSVTITESFYIGKYEVTQSQWEAVMGSNPSRFKGSNHPVENVSWNDVQTFLDKINALEGCNRCYRLPTEAQWEYAARAGTTTAYSFGNNQNQLGSYAWYSGNSGNKTHPVGDKRANPWGLYDMHGNVSEWVNDWHGGYSADSVTDPEGATSGSYRVFRGGSWINIAGYVRSSYRYGIDPGYRYHYLGFRLVRTYP